MNIVRRLVRAWELLRVAERLADRNRKRICFGDYERSCYGTADELCEFCRAYTRPTKPPRKGKGGK